MSDHNFSITTDFTSLVASIPEFQALSREVVAGGGNLATLIHIDRLGDTVTIRFTASLTAGDLTALTTIVNAHLGIPIPSTFEEVLAEAKNAAFKTLTYTSGGDLDTIESYSDVAKANKTYTQQFFYTSGGDLDRTELTREFDGAVFQKDLTFDSGGSLTDVDVTQL